MFYADSDNILKHLRELIGERNPFTSLKALQNAGRYILQEFEGACLDIQEQAVSFDGTVSQNVLGLKKGSSGTGELFVLGAHYDTVEGSPGADDNASAVAALLEILRLLQPVTLKTSLMFAGFTLEEYGLIGSRFFVEQSAENQVAIGGMISLEMLGFRNHQPGSQQFPHYVDAARYPDAGDFILVVGNEPSQDLTLSLAKTMQQAVPQLPVELLSVPGEGDLFPEIRLSDHSPFWDNGHRAVMVTDTAFFRNPHYHKSTDTLETLDIEFISDIATAIAGFLKIHLG
ncbi:MAG: M28 family peptidase [Nitrospinota bacterium]|nr:M28 family peptidase [Nitrospinota bacterium]